MAGGVTERTGDWQRWVLEAKRPPERVPGIYTRLAPVYELWARATESKARRRVLELASVNPGEDVLEVAMGTGVQLARLARANRGGRTVGVENSAGMLAKTRRTLQRSGLTGVEVVEGSALELPFADESFDLVVNSYMLDLLPREAIPRALAEFRRVLRPGGRLVLSNMTKGERRRERVWDWLYAKGVVLTGELPRGPRRTRVARARLHRRHARVPIPTDLPHRDRHRTQGEGMTDTAPETSELREVVRERYTNAAKAVADHQQADCGCGPAGCGEQVALTDASGAQVFGSALYGTADAQAAPAAAVEASLGCGVPTAVADLHHGETVLDLGSGAGADVFISARRVGPTGKAIGVDMTDEMLKLARRNAAEAGVTNVEFVKGYLEDLPLPDDSVDVVISNCVINLAADKRKVIAEAARVLRPGGRVAVSDVIADPDMDEATRADMQQWTGCIAGALTETEFRGALEHAGFEDIEIRETHRVHEHATSAIIRARKADAEGCCEPEKLDACCEPTAKEACCGSAAASSSSAPSSCGCQT